MQFRNVIKCGYRGVNVWGLRSPERQRNRANCFEKYHYHVYRIANAFSFVRICMCSLGIGKYSNKYTAILRHRFSFQLWTYNSFDFCIVVRLSRYLFAKYLSKVKLKVRGFNAIKCIINFERTQYINDAVPSVNERIAEKEGNSNTAIASLKENSQCWKITRWRKATSIGQRSMFRFSSRKYPFVSVRPKIYILAGDDANRERDTGTILSVTGTKILNQFNGRWLQLRWTDPRTSIREPIVCIIYQKYPATGNWLNFKCSVPSFSRVNSTSESGTL